ncbi:MAG: RNA methyltransferase [Pseudomonadota bacterium]
MIEKNSPKIILAEPQLGENIGMAARAMANFSLSDLWLVNPRDGWPNEMAVKAATGAHNIVHSATVFETVEDAVSDLNYILATTARPRDMVKEVITPEQAAKDMHKRLALGQKVGILFGRERVGLKNDEITLADAIVMAPVNPEFASLNISQAVLLVGYEWFKYSLSQTSSQALGRETSFDGPGMPGLNMRQSQPVEKKDLIAFFEHLEAELDQSGFLKPPEKRAAMIRNIRNMFQRMQATDQEVRTLRGIVSALTRVHERPRKI